MRRVLEHLDDRVVNQFAEKGLLYVSNLHGGQGLGMSWQRAYQSENREEVEERIRLKGLDFEWTGNGSLRVFMRASTTAAWRRRLEKPTDSTDTPAALLRDRLGLDYPNR